MIFFIFFSSCHEQLHESKDISRETSNLVVNHESRPAKSNPVHLYNISIKKPNFDCILINYTMTSQFTSRSSTLYTFALFILRIHLINDAQFFKNYFFSISKYCTICFFSDGSYCSFNKYICITIIT